jgi:hypothetical protein
MSVSVEAAAALTNRSSLNDDQLDNAITLVTQVRSNGTIAYEI